MTTNYQKLTFISICYNDPGISQTVHSIRPYLILGSKHIIQNGGTSIDPTEYELSRVYNEPDNGIYNAINKAITKVKTKYFILIHAGDEFIGNKNDLGEILNSLDKRNSDLSLNNQLIGSRRHFSNLWKPWMLYFGAQPPHLPTIYRTDIFKNIHYSEKIPIIADFEFFKSLKWSNYHKDNKLLIKMATGGRTSSGFRSFMFVNRCYLRVYGINGWLYILFRIPFKIIQTIKI
jgi:hypothetical protein